MASVSLSILRGASHLPDAIVVAADAPANANSIEVRIDKAAGFTTLEVEFLLDAIARRLLDGRSNLINVV